MAKKNSYQEWQKKQKKRKNKFRLKHIIYVVVAGLVNFFLDWIFDEREPKKKDKKKKKK